MILSLPDKTDNSTATFSNSENMLLVSRYIMYKYTKNRSFLAKALKISGLFVFNISFCVHLVWVNNEKAPSIGQILVKRAM